MIYVILKRNNQPGVVPYPPLNTLRNIKEIIVLFPANFPFYRNWLRINRITKRVRYLSNYHNSCVSVENCDYMYMYIVVHRKLITE